MCSTGSDKSEQPQIVFILSKKLLKLKIDGGTKMKTETEQVKSEVFGKSHSEKNEVGRSFVLPKRWCDFCGRKTTHSVNERVCLVCGFVARKST
jgi:ribosomal protein L37E